MHSFDKDYEYEPEYPRDIEIRMRDDLYRRNELPEPNKRVRGEGPQWGDFTEGLKTLGFWIGAFAVVFAFAALATYPWNDDANAGPSWHHDIDVERICAPSKPVNFSYSSGDGKHRVVCADGRVFSK